MPYPSFDEFGEPITAWHKPAKTPIGILGEDIYACPRQDLMQRPLVWNSILKFYGMYKSGHFPDRGAVVDQSNKAIELFRVIDDANAECDKQEEEDRKRNAGRPAGRRGG